MEIRPIAHMRSDFSSKFGIPRQAGLASALRSEIVFEEEFRDPSALRGLAGFSHIWLIWGFSEAPQEGFHPTVRPPRLGGNERVGVFATRSPFRPNSLGLSCVEIEAVEENGPEGPRIRVRGADLMDGTPIYDIKPYVPYADARPDAREGFASAPAAPLTVEAPAGALAAVPEDRREALAQILSCDPRPRYQDDPTRVYGFGFAGCEIRFRVEGDVLTVLSAEPV